MECEARGMENFLWYNLVISNITVNKTLKIFINSIPILAMIGLIPFVKNDYLLSVAYLVVMSISFIVKREKNELTIFASGFILMIIFEYLFVSTRVETFIRNSLFGLMPIWLPLLWGYGFVAIKRAAKILDEE